MPDKHSPLISAPGSAQRSSEFLSFCPCASTSQHRIRAFRTQQTFYYLGISSRLPKLSTQVSRRQCGATVKLIKAFLQDSIYHWYLGTRSFQMVWGSSGTVNVLYGGNPFSFPHVYSNYVRSLVTMEACISGHWRKTSLNTYFKHIATNDVSINNHDIYILRCLIHFKSSVSIYTSNEKISYN